jgi:hypothetical protein
MTAMTSARHTLKKQIQLMLGIGMVEVELDPEHLDLAITLAIQRYRQRSDGSTNEDTMFMNLQEDQNVYNLPENVQEIRKIYRRGVGVTIGGGGINFDPFEAAFSNYFLLQWGQTGGLATWELFSEYKETLARVFSSEINFIWNESDHKLTLLRRPEGEETVMVTVYLAKAEDDLITGTYSGPWIRDYALAQSKFMLGEARSKITSGLPGPNGNVTLNGDALKQEGLAEMQRLEEEILQFVTSDRGMPFIIG